MSNNLDNESHSQDYEPANGDAPVMANAGALTLIFSWIGAGLSIALVIGLIYWAVQLSVRNPNEVPIIRAMEGPSKTKPTDPGGEQASHQGLAVNSVQEEGGVDASADTVVLAPSLRPLDGEDVSGAELNEIVVDPEIPEPDTTLAAATTDSLVDPDEPTEENIEVASIAPVTADEDSAAPIRSTRPKSRPTASQIEELIIAAQGEEPASTDLDSVPLGTRLVQLGAYDARALAEREWINLLAKHEDLLQDKQRLIQSAESGGRTFYRLRAVGFASLDESRILCSALLARSQPCIPVTAR